MSTVKANDLTNVTGGIPTVKSQQLIPTAWVNFNGSSTVAIRDSEGVSSITDISTGNTFVNFATTMSNANYSATIGDSNASNTWTNSGRVTSFTTASLRTITTNTGSYYDESLVCVIVLGGQA